MQSILRLPRFVTNEISVVTLVQVHLRFLLYVERRRLYYYSMAPGMPGVENN